MKIANHEATSKRENIIIMKITLFPSFGNENGQVRNCVSFALDSAMWCEDASRMIKKNLIETQKAVNHLDGNGESVEYSAASSSKLKGDGVNMIQGNYLIS